MAEAEQLLQDMMEQYCKPVSSSVYPDMKKLREVLTLLSDQQKLHILKPKLLHILKQKHPVLTPLRRAAAKNHTEIINTLLSSLQSSADRFRLLMVIVDDEDTPLHTAAFWGNTESVKMILDCLTLDQQIQIMSVQCRGDTAIQLAENDRHTDTVRVLTEYQHRACGESVIIFNNY